MEFSGDFLKIKENCYMACLWPAADFSKTEEVEKELRSIGRILYTRDVYLTFQGLRNFMIQIYGHQAWAGNRENHYKGVQGKAAMCYMEGKPVRTYLFEAKCPEEVIEVKEKIRNLLGLKKHSIHISDDRCETAEIVKLLYHQNAVDYLNTTRDYRYGEFYCKLEKKKISVIVPVYNVKNYVTRCIESILAQTYKEFELILVDDGSTDGSGEICQKFKEKDSRIHLIRQENKGLSAARNRGLKEAKGEYITYIDSDDYVDGVYLETLYQNIRKYDADVAVCGYQPVWEENEKKEQERSRKRFKKSSGKVICNDNRKLTLYSGKEAAGEIVEKNRRNMIVAWGKLYHASLREQLIFPEGKTHEDEFVTYKVLYSARRVVESNQAGYRYVQRRNSIMNGGYGRKRLDKLLALKEAIAFFEGEGEVELAQYAVKRYVLNLQIAWYKVKKYMPKEKTIPVELKREWRDIYSVNKKKIRQTCNPVDSIAIKTFEVSPGLYSIIAGVIDERSRNVL